MSQTESSCSYEYFEREINELRAQNEKLKQNRDEIKDELQYLRGEVEGLKFAIRCRGRREDDN